MSADADSDPAEDPGSNRCTPEADVEEGPQGSVTLVEFHYDTKSRSEVRKLALQIGHETKTIWHYLFNRWPDYAKPEGEDRRALLELTKQTATQAGDPSLNPRFVHCSAGVGRTGTFIALDFLLNELFHGHLEVPPSASSPTSSTSSSRSSRPTSSNQHTQTSPELESDSPSTSPQTSSSSSLTTTPGKESTPEAKEDVVFETVNTLREQRMMMVMNDVQLGFLYEVLREAYIDMYSSLARRAKGVGINTNDSAGLLLGDEDGADAGDASMGEPSPKMARMANMLFVGAAADEVPGWEEGERGVRGGVNTRAVEVKSLVEEGGGVRGGDAADVGMGMGKGMRGGAGVGVGTGRAAEVDPYAAVDPAVVRRGQQ